MEIYWTIYKTTNNKNGKFYIGKHKTKNPMDSYLGSGLLLNRSIAKHGRNSFTKDIIFLCGSEGVMNIMESIIVSPALLRNPFCYNLAPGGQGGDVNYLKSLIEKKDIYDKILESRIRNGNLLDSKDVREKKSNAAKIRIKSYPNSIPDNKNRVHTLDTRKKMSDLQKTMVWITNGSINHRIRNSEEIPQGFYRGKSGVIGHKHSIDSIKKIRESNLEKRSYTNGKKNIWIFPGDEIPQSYYLGMTQNHQEKIWITDGESSRKILKTKKIPEGFKRGRNANTRKK